MSEKDEKILNQPVSEEELKEVAGGSAFTAPEKRDEDMTNCYIQQYRNFYVNGEINCAATVEDGSWCGSNDACYESAVDYQGMKCGRAWK